VRSNPRVVAIYEYGVDREGATFWFTSGKFLPKIPGGKKNYVYRKNEKEGLFLECRDSGKK